MTEQDVAIKKLKRQLKICNKKVAKATILRPAALIPGFICLLLELNKEVNNLFHPV